MADRSLLNDVASASEKNDQSIIDGWMLYFLGLELWRMDEISRPAALWPRLPNTTLKLGSPRFSTWNVRGQASVRQTALVVSTKTLVNSPFLRLSIPTRILASAIKNVLNTSAKKKAEVLLQVSRIYDLIKA